MARPETTIEVVDVAEVVFADNPKRPGHDLVNIVAADGRVFASTVEEFVEAARLHLDASRLEIAYSVAVNGKWTNRWILGIAAVADTPETVTQGAPGMASPASPAAEASAELVMRAAELAERLSSRFRAGPPQDRFVALIPVLLRVCRSGGESVAELAALADALGADGQAALARLTLQQAAEPAAEAVPPDGIDPDDKLPWDDEDTPDLPPASQGPRW
jgi:hypothetical protein